MPDVNHSTLQRMLFVVTDALLAMTVVLCFLNLKLYSDMNAIVQSINAKQVFNMERISALEAWRNTRQQRKNDAASQKQ